MDGSDVRAWVQGYVTAWATNEPNDIRALFAPDARYFTAPDRDPWVGKDAIVEGWRAIGDRPGDWVFGFDVLAVSGSLTFVRGHTTYRDPPAVYSNLWVIRFGADGRCVEFTEWWMEAGRDDPAG